MAPSNWKKQFLLLSEILDQFVYLAKYQNDADQLDRIKNFIHDEIQGNYWQRPKEQ